MEHYPIMPCSFVYLVTVRLRCKIIASHPAGLDSISDWIFLLFYLDCRAVIKKCRPHLLLDIICLS
jgi:hypothetical protein